MRLRPCLVAITLFAVFSSRPSSAQGRMSTADSAVIARELAVWDALQKKDSGAAFVKLVGNSPRLILVTPDGLAQMSASEVGKSVTTRCERRKNQLDSAHVERVTDDVVVLTYRVLLEGRCGAGTAWSADTLYSMSVWKRRGASWQAVGQAVAAKANAR